MVSRSWSSRVPDAMDALVTRLQAVTAGTVIKVRDGPWLEGGTDPQVLVIGFTGFQTGYQRPIAATSEDFGTAAVTASGMQDGLGAGIREMFTISCASVVRTGDTKQVSAARRQAYANIAIVGSVLTEPPLWLNGTVMKAILGTAHSLDYAQDRRGLLAFVPFTVECEGFAQQ